MVFNHRETKQCMNTEYIYIYMSTQLLMAYSVFAIYKNFTFLTVDYTS